MNQLSRHFALSTGALAVSLLVAACGGGDASPPPDTLAPTVVITDSEAGASASGPVTFTFTFSESVGSSFSADDVVVTGGTKGAFAMAADGLSATLVVTPTANSSGVLKVDVAAGAFSDTSSNASTAAYTASQDYSTVVPSGGSGATGTCTGANCTDFSAAGIGFQPFENPAGTVEIANDPNDATNKVVKFVKKPADPEFFGTVINGLAGPAVLTDSDKTVTLRVFSPAVGTNMLLKFEGGTGGPTETEKDVVTTKANEWETLSFVMPAAGTFSTVVLFPNGRSKVSADKTIYVDELKFPAAGGPAPGACAAPNCVDFSAAGIGFTPFENPAGTVEIANDPGNASNKVVKFVKKPADPEFFGTVITGLGVKPVLTASAKTVTMRVFSPAVGTNFLLKFEGGTGGPTETEKDVVTTKAGEWETLSFVMPGVGTYNTVVVFPNGRTKVAADKVMYIDDLTFPATVASGGSGNGGVFAGGVFADDYVGDLFANSKSTQGGDVGFFFDPRLGSTKAYDYAGVAGSAQNPGGVPNFYFGLGLNPPAITDAYFGAFVKAPGNAPVNVAGFTNIKVNVWGPDELFKAGAFPALTVVLQGPAVAGCGSSSGGSEVERTFNTTGQGADKVYSLPLSSFTITTACSGETTVAQVLASISQFNIVLKNTNIQYLNKDGGGVGFTNGLNIGSIKFD
jgi:Bacterial Ig-like domain